MLRVICRQILTRTRERGRQARWYSNGSSVMRGKTAGAKDSCCWQPTGQMQELKTIDGFPGRDCKACGDTDGVGLVVYTISDVVLTWNLDHGWARWGLIAIGGGGFQKFEKLWIQKPRGGKTRVFKSCTSQIEKKDKMIPRMVWLFQRSRRLTKYQSLRINPEQPTCATSSMDDP